MRASRLRENELSWRSISGFAAFSSPSSLVPVVRQMLWSPKLLLPECRERPPRDTPKRCESLTWIKPGVPCRRSGAARRYLNELASIMALPSRWAAAAQNDLQHTSRRSSRNTRVGVRVHSAERNRRDAHDRNDPDRRNHQTKLPDPGRGGSARCSRRRSRSETGFLTRVKVRGSEFSVFTFGWG